MNLRFPLFLLSAIILAQTFAIQLTYSPGENVCLLPFQNRGPVQNLSLVNYCDDQNFTVVNGECLGPCNSGYEYLTDWTSYTCMEKCPEGIPYSRFMVWCFNMDYDGKIFNYKSMSSCERAYGAGNCTTKGGEYIPWCELPNSNLTLTCAVNKTHSRETVPKESKLGCEKGFEEIDGLCYPDCPKGYQTFGKTCLLRQCAAGYTQCGQFCTKEASCENPSVQSFGKFFTGIQRLSEESLVKIDLSSLVCASPQAMKATKWIRN